MKRVSSDGFGISIQADDPQFAEADVRALLVRAGGTDIAPVFFEPEELDHGQTLFDVRFLGLLVGVALVVAGGTYVSLNKIAFIEPYSWMMVQGKLKPQAPSALFADGKGMRAPVPGTVARGFLPYAFSGKPDSAGRTLANPLPVTEGTLERGHGKFLTYCSPCHGNFGRGDSRLRGQFPNPPTLMSDKVRNWPDGSIYHVITEGQNVMPSYAAQVGREDRWAIIHYIRALQRAQFAKESDLK
jgi:mono/diheme cytochrome c family protein